MHSRIGMLTEWHDLNSISDRKRRKGHAVKAKIEIKERDADY
jgi:hypothetical protein